MNIFNVLFVYDLYATWMFSMFSSSMVFMQHEHFQCSLCLWFLCNMNIFNVLFLIFTEEISRFECLLVGDAGVNNFVFRGPFLSHQPALHRDGTSAIDLHNLTYSINNFHLSWDVFVLWSGVFASIWIFHVISDEIGSCVFLFFCFWQCIALLASYLIVLTEILDRYYGTQELSDSIANLTLLVTNDSTATPYHSN